MTFMNEGTAPKLPNGLSSLALERFDKLLSEGKLIYGPSTPETVQHNGFTVSPQLSHPPL